MLALPVLLAAAAVALPPSSGDTRPLRFDRRAEEAAHSRGPADLAPRRRAAGDAAARPPGSALLHHRGPRDVDFDSVSRVASAFVQINAHRDIVFVDQRQVGGSNPLECAASLTGSVGDFVRACLGAVDADVLMYRTPQAMDDLDSVRQALGYTTINVYGGSYGATAAQVYLRRHPETVRSVILDGATLLDVPVFERWSSSGQRALALVDKRCRADRDCRRAFPTWFKRFPALLQRLARHPQTVGGVRFDAALTAGTVEDMTTSASRAAGIPFVLARAEAGKLTPLVHEITSASALASGGFALMPWAIMCTEPWAARDPAKVYADARGTYLRYSEPSTAVQVAAGCAVWPKPDLTVEDWSRVSSPVPTLVLVGGADPKDPIGNIAGITIAMPNARVVVVPGQGHGVAFLGCMPYVIDQFLAQPQAGSLDTSCVRLISTPPFRLR